MKKQVENGKFYTLDFVCPSDDKEQPFCDYEDDELWTYAYYDSKIDYLWKSKHDYINCLRRQNK